MLRLFSALLLLPMILSAQPAPQPLSAAEAVAIGLENSFGIRIARNNQAVALHNQTPGRAGMLPRIDLSASQNFASNNTRQQFFSGDERSAQGAQSQALNSGLQLSWTAFDGFAMFIRWDRFEALGEQAALDLRVAVEQSALSILLAYYNLVQQERRDSVLQNNLRLSEERRTLARSRLQVGAGSEQAYLQALVAFRADSALLIGQEVALAQARAELNRLMARDPQTPAVPARDIPLEALPPLSELEARLAGQNPSLLRARNSMAIAQLDTRLADSRRYPVLSFSSAMSFNRSANEVGVLQSNRSFGPSAGLALSFNLYDGGNLRHDRAIAHLQADNAQISYEQLLLDLRSSLFQLYTAYEGAAQSIAIESANLDIARRNLRIATETYRLGSIRDLEVRQAQQDLLEAENRQLDAQIRARQTQLQILWLCSSLDLPGA